eukprot:1187177-Prorocentrum_minimum.AAC.9
MDLCGRAGVRRGSGGRHLLDLCGRAGRRVHKGLHMMGCRQPQRGGCIYGIAIASPVAGTVRGRYGWTP